ncbi:hypothetical protein WG66_003976 [Moniliophthora roreri]|nr:hypothetical protein WG66_003976 [Moniliophthora roreri]
MLALGTLGQRCSHRPPSLSILSYKGSEKIKWDLRTPSLQVMIGRGRGLGVITDSNAQCLTEDDKNLSTTLFYMLPTSDQSPFHRVERYSPESRRSIQPEHLYHERLYISELPTIGVCCRSDPYVACCNASAGRVH